jgi:SpoIID/LytB domain protein
VHASHFRWSRVIPVRDLAEKLNRRRRLGRLLSVAVERRSGAGNAAVLKLTGTKGAIRLDSELNIRSLLGTGSLRSTLFFIRSELGASGRLEQLVIHGGGWGHGVGLCQSGAMGRAEAGETYEQIVKAYFPGTELGSLKY